MIELAALGYDTAGGPAPYAIAGEGGIGQEADLVLTAAADGGNQETCTTAFHAGEGLGL